MWFRIEDEVGDSYIVLESQIRTIVKNITSLYLIDKEELEEIKKISNFNNEHYIIKHYGKRVIHSPNSNAIIDVEFLDFDNYLYYIALKEDNLPNAFLLKDFDKLENKMVMLYKGKEIVELERLRFVSLIEKDNKKQALLTNNKNQIIYKEIA